MNAVSQMYASCLTLQHTATHCNILRLTATHCNTLQQGSWSYVEPRIVTALKEINGVRPLYVGRNASASPATGNPAIHQAELDHLLKDAFDAEYKHTEWQWKLKDLQKN